MRGKPHDSLTYCTKSDATAFQYGETPKQGKRNDLHEVVSLVMDGKSVKQICQSDDVASVATVVKYHRGLSFLRNNLVHQRTAPPKVYWLHGETGTGKTWAAERYATTIYDPTEYWISSGSLKWFDGYDGQKVAIFDDFRPHDLHFNYLLRLLDRYPCTVEIKGGTVPWIPHVIIITSPNPPSVTFNTTENLAQVERRITRVFEFPDQLREFESQIDIDGILALPGEDGADTGVEQAVPGRPDDGGAVRPDIHAPASSSSSSSSDHLDGLISWDESGDDAVRGDGDGVDDASMGSRGGTQELSIEFPRDRRIRDSMERDISSGSGDERPRGNARLHRQNATLSRTVIDLCDSDVDYEIYKEPMSPFVDVPVTDEEKSHSDF